MYLFCDVISSSIIVFFHSSHRKWCRKEQNCRHGPLVRYVKSRVAHAPGMPGTFSSPPWIRDPDMHHGTCVTHVPWFIPGSLISSFFRRRKSGNHFSICKIFSQTPRTSNLLASNLLAVRTEQRTVGGVLKTDGISTVNVHILVAYQDIHCSGRLFTTISQSKKWRHQPFAGHVSYPADRPSVIRFGLCSSLSFYSLHNRPLRSPNASELHGNLIVIDGVSEPSLRWLFQETLGNQCKPAQEQ